MLFVNTLLICCFLILYEADATYNAESAKRQCSCAEQTECFVAIKDETEKCFDGAYGTVYDELKKYGNPNKMKPCFDKFTNFVKKWINCVNENLIKDKSCLPHKKDVKIPSKDFLTIYVNGVC
uniref:Uncharacterized protein n=1 Tax=Globodera rostochiensis TaxID=31243 RepID=A0A914IED0_GLORO